MSTPVDRPMKAFSVQENYEDTGGILFARHSVTARRLGADQYAEGDFSGARCRRAPWADHCADTGVVPAALMVEHGWWFECTGCGRRIDESLPELWAYEGEQDGEASAAAARYRDWKPADVVGTQHSQVFCDARCEQTHAAHEAERARRAARIAERFKRIILARFPDATLLDGEGYRAGVHVYVFTDDKGGWCVGQVRVPFEYPGMQYGPGSLDYDRTHPARPQRPNRPHYTCAGGDLEVFNAYCAAHPALSSRGVEA